MNRIRCVAVLVALLLGLTGCSLDVESFLSPPGMQGEQQAVQQALETYLRDSDLTKLGHYTLKYPTEGAHTSAFVLCDEQGRPLTEATSQPRLAVAFYALPSAPEETHVNLLCRSGEEWVSMGDCLGSGTDIRQVAFGDLDGDGMQELLAGWSTYNSRDHRLAAYRMTDGLTQLATDRVYTGLYVGNMQADDRDELVLLHIGSEGVTATLERYADNALHTLGTVRLDSGIQQFGGMTAGRLTADLTGLYVDALKSDKTTITELIYYDGTLRAPFCDQTAATNTVTGRGDNLSARDVDGDGCVEIPAVRPFSGSALPATHVAEQMTVWRSWDHATGRLEDCLLTVTNPADGYLVVLDETTAAKVSTTYVTSDRTLTVWREGAAWLWLCAGTASAPAEGLTSLVLWYGADGSAACTVCFDPEELDVEKVRYMVLRLTE